MLRNRAVCGSLVSPNATLIGYVGDVSKPFFIAGTKSKPPRTAEALDVAARHLVYKLFEATDGMLGVWHVLAEIGERPATSRGPSSEDG